MQKALDIAVNTMIGAGLLALVVLSANAPFDEPLPGRHTAKCVQASASVTALFVPVCK